MNISNLARSLHGMVVMRRRVTVLSERLSEFFPVGSTVLDIGAGSGEMAFEINRLRPDLKIVGIDLKVRSDAKIVISAFNGVDINHDNESFDYCLLVDVLHHVKEPDALLLEACRVTKRGMVIKDHICESYLDKLILSFMDWVGNRPFGVNLEYNYLCRDDWNKLFSFVGLKIDKVEEKTRIYGFPFNLLFDRGMHVIMRVLK